MNYNNEFKIIDTEEKAYFLGLFFADGSISQLPRKESNYVKHQVQISLTDEQIVRDLHQHFPFFNLGEFDFSRYKSSWSKQFNLRKTSTELFNDLIKCGVRKNKSGVNSNDLFIPEINDSLVSHFIRGFFDGDGSISAPSARPNLRVVDMCGASDQFLLSIKSVLESNGITCPPLKKRTKGYKNPLFILFWVNTMDILDLRDYLYKNATIYLDRKKKLFDSLQLVDKKQDNPTCPYCNSHSSHKQGIRYTNKRVMHRYHCTNCEKRFSVPAPSKKSCELLESPEEGNQQPSIVEMQ